MSGRAGAERSGYGDGRVILLGEMGTTCERVSVWSKVGGRLTICETAWLG